MFVIVKSPSEVEIIDVKETTKNLENALKNGFEIHGLAIDRINAEIIKEACCECQKKILETNKINSTT